MEALDLLVIAVYLVGIFGVGVWAGREGGGKDAEGFFLAGRQLPWWLLGTSMVATTLAADTPLTVAGLTLSKGVAGNWFWWSFAISHVLVALVIGPLWRRAEVVTDAEFCEFRYGGREAAFLRGLKAFYFAVPINCIVMGWVFLAMEKVSLAVVPEWPVSRVVGVLLLLTLVYSVRSGFRGVVLTDLVQFPLALGGSILLAWIAVREAGGLTVVVEAAVDRAGPQAIALFPVDSELLPWHALFAFLGVQWWAQKYADGGGIFIQRLLAARSERDAALGGLWFCIAHYVLRPWPWVLTGMAAVVLVPEAVQMDPEGAYPVLLREVLPAGLRGLLVASFLAAFMSTIDTHLNWGSSYVVHDLLVRWRLVAPDRTVLASRLSVVGMALLALVSTRFMDTIAGAWEFVTAFGAGSGAVILLRWYWWRITAGAEIAAMVASTVLAVGVYTLAPEDWPYLYRLVVIVGGSALVWIPVTWRSTVRPEQLVAFYQRVRPPGPGWKAVAAVAGLPAPGPLLPGLVRWVLGTGAILAGLLGLGDALLGAPLRGGVTLLIGAILVALIALRTRSSG